MKAGSALFLIFLMVCQQRRCGSPIGAIKSSARQPKGAINFLCTSDWKGSYLRQQRGTASPRKRTGWDAAPECLLQLRPCNDGFKGLKQNIGSKQQNIRCEAQGYWALIRSVLSLLSSPLFPSLHLTNPFVPLAQSLFFFVCNYPVKAHVAPAK